MNFIGEIAGLTTAVFFPMTALISITTGQSVGSQATNRVCLIFVLFYLVILDAVLFREPLPLSADFSRWLWLRLSGIIGLALGDAFLFQAFILLGARLGTLLLLGLAPIFGSILAWLFFDETLSIMQVTRIVLAVGFTQ